uniref:NAD(P)-dependent oxidoreductase n=1 Tax=Agathobacter sp. TaxID=2021311 RepID=UPI00405683E3
MDRHTIVFTTDKRQKNLCELLSGEREMCSFAEYERRRKLREENAEKIYVLPTPVSKLESYESIKEKIKEELRRHKANDKITVFGGVLTKEWTAFLKGQNIAYVDFMEQEEVVKGNAKITAEGVVAELLQKSAISIEGQQVLVTGFGRCGKCIAEKLAALGAHIVILARSAKAREEAVEQGYEAYGFSYGKCIASKANTLINTVPAMVVTREILEELPRDAVVLDIASKPGGVDFCAAKELGIYAKLSLGLPGIYTTKSSAMLLEKAISDYAPVGHDRNGGRLWIFQVII